MYKLAFFVPESHLEATKLAVFKAGGGHIGDYDQCCWQTLGTGQFRPKAQATPFIGQTECLETLAEYRVELVVDPQHIRAVVLALVDAHPYEEPAYDLWPLTDLSQLPE